MLKRLFLILLLSLAPAFAQQGNVVMIVFPGVPSGTCSSTMVALDVSNGEFYSCNGSAWLKVGPGAAGAATWNSISNPDGNQSLTMAARTTIFTWGATTGAGVDMFSLLDTTGNTGTGYILSVSTTGTSAAKAIRITDGGTADGVELSTSAVFQPIGTGSILADNLASGTINALTDFNSALCGTNEILEDQGGSWACIATPTGGGGLTHTVNGSALASATALDLDDALPAAPANSINVNWAKDALDPTNISASILMTEIVQTGTITSGTWNGTIITSAFGGTGANNTATTGRYLRGDGTDFLTSSVAAGGAGPCTNQFVTATVDNAAPTCTTATLASAQFANQGTTTTVLHGNAAGNPSFGSVVPADMDLTVNYTWTGQHDFDTAEILSAIPIRFEGLTDDNIYITITITDPTVGRTFTLPNADSNSVQPLTCTGDDKVSAISGLGVITCSTDQTAGGANWEAITNLANTATLYTGDNNAETFTINWTSNWATDRFTVSQGAGNPTAGSLVTISYTDTDIDALTISDGTNTLVANSGDMGALALFPTGAAEIHATEVLINVEKGSAGTITVGQVVYQSGFDAVGNVIEVELADSDSAATMPAIGVAQQTITDTVAGHIVAFGTLTNIDTSSFSVGDDLYVSGTAGDLTATKPTGTALIQKVAQVGRSHVSLGVIEVFGAGRSNDLPNIANDNIWIGNGSGVPVASIIIDCVDTGGNHLNYTQSTNAFACGTSVLATTVLTDQSNTYSTGDQSFASASSLTVPTAAGAAPTSSGDIRYDSTSFTLEYGDNGTNRLFANLDEAQTFTSKTLDDPLFSTKVRFTAVAAPSYAAGQLFYDSTDQALGFHNDESDVTLQIGQEEWIRARNESGSTITNGQVVYIDGIASGLPRIALARANAMATSEVVGLATHDIENLSNGYVTASGLVRDFDTSSFTIGDRLYLSPSTAGALTATAPSDPNFVVPVGIVTEVNATTGDVLVTLGAPRPRGDTGIAVVGNDLRTASTEEGFLNAGALTCGANTAGSMRVHTTPLQYCDDAATPLLQYAAYGAVDGDALAGDDATSFFDTGTIEAARLPSAAAATLGVIELDNALGGTAAAVELAAGVAGDGITLNTATAPDSLDIDLNATVDGVGSTSNLSGMEFTATGELALLQGCALNDILKYNTTGDLWECATDVSGGAPTLDSIADPVAATDWIFGTTTETLLLDFQAAFTTGNQIEFKQSTGDPSGGTLVRITVPDADVTPFVIHDGTNPIFTVAQDGTVTVGGTGPGLYDMVTGTCTTGNTGEVRICAHTGNLLSTSENAGVVTEIAKVNSNPAAGDVSGSLAAGYDVDSFDGGLATTTHAAGATFGQGLRHATDCTAITDGEDGEVCWEQDANTFYVCENGAGCAVPGDWTALAGAGGGHTITVNGSALASATAADFDDALPAAPSNSVNVNFLKDALDPTNISANLLLTEIDGTGIAVSGTELIVDLLTADDQAGSTSNQSGMEFGDTGSDKLGLLRGCSNGQLLKFNTTGGLWACQNDDDSGGSPAWEALVNTADTATSYTSTADAETVTFDFQSNFAADRFIIKDSTGNPTAGTLLQVTVTDPQVEGVRVEKNTTDEGSFFNISNSNTASRAFMRVISDTAQGGIAAYGSTHATAADETWFWSAGASGKLLIRQDGAKPIEFWTNGSEQGTISSAGAWTIGGSLEAGTLTEGGVNVVVDTLTLTGGNGIATLGDLSANRTVAIDLLTADDQTGSTSNQSGMEFGDTGSDKLGLLRGCGNGQLLKFNTTGGLWACQNDNDSGGSPAWEALVNTADTSTDYLSNNTAEVVTFDFQAAFTAGSQFNITQTVGNPTAGVSLVGITVADTDVLNLLLAATATAQPVLLIDMDQPSVTGQRDSHSIDIRGTAYDGTGHNADWRIFVDVIADTGTSEFKIQERIDGGGFTDNLRLDFNGNLVVLGGVTASGNLSFMDGTGQFGEFDHSNTSARTWSLPDLTGTIALINQANTWTVGAQDFTSTPTLTLPVSAGAAPTANGVIAYDSTANCLEYGDNGTNRCIVNLDEAQTLTTKTLTAPIIATISNTGTLTLPTSTDTLVGRATTDTFTNKALDVEDTGNVITTVSKIYIDGASCIGATATLNWDDAGTGDTAPTAACNDTGSIQRPSADFAGGAVNSFERTIRLPSDWASAENVDISIRYVSVAASPTGNVEWDVSTICRAAGQTWDAAFNAAQTITDAVAAQNVLNDGDQAAVTMTTCAPDEDWSLKVSRDGTNDTNNDLAKLLSVMITLRRDQ